MQCYILYQLFTMPCITFASCNVMVQRSKCLVATEAGVVTDSSQWHTREDGQHGK